MQGQELEPVAGGVSSQAQGRGDVGHHLGGAGQRVLAGAGPRDTQVGDELVAAPGEQDDGGAQVVRQLPQGGHPGGLGPPVGHLGGLPHQVACPPVRESPRPAGAPVADPAVRTRGQSQDGARLGAVIDPDLPGALTPAPFEHLELVGEPGAGGVVALQAGGQPQQGLQAGTLVHAPAHEGVQVDVGLPPHDGEGLGRQDVGQDHPARAVRPPVGGHGLRVQALGYHPRGVGRPGADHAHEQGGVQVAQEAGRPLRLGRAQVQAPAQVLQDGARPVPQHRRDLGQQELGGGHRPAGALRQGLGPTRVPRGRSLAEEAGEGVADGVGPHP